MQSTAFLGIEGRLRVLSTDVLALRWTNLSKIIQNHSTSVMNADHHWSTLIITDHHWSTSLISTLNIWEIWPNQARHPDISSLVGSLREKVARKDWMDSKSLAPNVPTKIDFKTATSFNCLVVWNMTFMTFHIYIYTHIGNNSPIWLSYFSEGLKPATS